MDKLNIAELILKSHAQQSPEKCALIIIDKIDETRKFTYLELYQQVCKLAAGLSAYQLPKGSVVCIQAPDAFDLLISFLAAIAVDLVPVLLLQSLVADGINYILKHSQARLFIDLNTIQKTIQPPKECHQISLHEYTQLKNCNFKDMQPTTLFNDPAFIFYTSGSTGEPKGVMHAQHVILGRGPSLRYWLNLQSTDIVLQTDNMCWTYSMFTGLLDPLFIGATAVIFNPSNMSSTAEDSISGATWLKIIETYQVSVIASTPDIYLTILNDQSSKQHKISCLRLAGCAGALLAESTQKLWQQRFHMPIYIALGMTEISTFISTGPSIPHREHTIGKIQPGRKVTLLPLEGGFDKVPLHTTGMLAVHQDELGLMIGYLGESKKNNSHYRGDWFLTQDLLTMDEEGYLTYLGRMDSILKIRGGYRVSPIQVEQVIKSCKEIKDAACGAIYDDQSKTDILVAYIVSDNPNQQLSQSIHQHIAKHLSDYKMPEFLFFVSSLPYSRRGKIIRSELKNLPHQFEYRAIKN